MRVLIAWGTRMGGTEGIAQTLAEQLRSPEVTVDLVPAELVRRLDAYDAVIIGGALYANRWHRAARRLVTHNVRQLRRVPVWLFSSGPLDDSAERATIPPTPQVAALADRIGALGHMTFGGRLPADAHGFPARAMAREHAGDWRNRDHIRLWGKHIARELPTASPGHPIDHPARSVRRLVAHGVVGWAACGAVMAGLLAVASPAVAVAVHAIAAPLIFALISLHYFHPPGARAPLPVAVAFTGIVMALDAVIVAGLIQHSAAMFASFAGTWLPFALIFAATGITGFVMSMLPLPPQRSNHGTPATVAPR